MPESHSLMDGKLHVYRRENSRFWQCATYLNGRNHRQSTKETNIAFAREFAREWYLDRVAEARLRKSGKLPAAPETSVVIPARVAPKRPGEKTFREAAAVFEKEFEAMTLGERNTHYVAGKGRVDELGLKKDRDGKPRTAYSLRHTYISMRLMEGADIYQVAKNCRTSVEMIQKFYAAHLKDELNASVINARRKRETKAGMGGRDAPA